MDHIGRVLIALGVALMLYALLMMNDADAKEPEPYVLIVMVLSGGLPDVQAIDMPSKTACEATLKTMKKQLRKGGFKNFMMQNATPQVVLSCAPR